MAYGNRTNPRPVAPVAPSLQELMLALAPQQESPSQSVLPFGLSPRGVPNYNFGASSPQSAPVATGVPFAEGSGPAPSQTSLADLLGVGATASRNFQGPSVDEVVQEPPMSASAQNLMMLQQMLDGGMGGDESTSEAIRNAISGAGAPFSAQIQSIKNQNKRAKQDTEFGSKAIRKMYNKLGRSFGRQAKKEEAATGRLSERLLGTGKESAEAMQASLRDNLDANAAAGEVLGSEALADSLNSQVQARNTEGTERLMDQAQRDSSTALKRGDNSRRWLQQGVSGSRLEGTNRAADLFNDLQDYLQGNRDKIGELRGQAAGARASAAASLAQAQSQSQQQAFENRLRLAQLLSGQEQQLFDNQLAQQELLGAGMNAGAPDFVPKDQQYQDYLFQMLGPQGQKIWQNMSDNTSMGTGVYDTPSGEARLDNFRNMQDYLQNRISIDPELGAGMYNQLTPEQRTALIRLALTQVARPQEPQSPYNR